MDGRIDTAAETPLTRLRAVVETDRLDLAALIWMVGVLVYVGSAICFAVMFNSEADRLGGTTDTWATVLQLSHTVDLAVLGALVIGLAIAAAVDSALSRAAAMLGVVGGAWAVVAGFMRIAFQAAAPDKTQASGQSVFEYGTGFVVIALGALVAVAALRLYTTVRYDFDDEDDDLEERALS
jgi:hypothetical protein